MKKAFTYEDRVEAIRLRLEEEVTFKKIAEIFGTSPTIVERWVRIYRIHGYAGLQIKPYNMFYDQAFKDKVIKDVLENHMSGTSASAKYNVGASTIRRWCVEYTRGIKMNGKRKVISAEEAAQIREKHKNTKDPFLKEVLVKNEYLEMENAILKKLEALTRQQPKKK